MRNVECIGAIAAIGNREKNCSDSLFRLLCRAKFKQKKFSEPLNMCASPNDETLWLFQVQIESDLLAVLERMSLRNEIEISFELHH
jgi:hypothetical protein